jgi:uracil-DNA glycosylase
MSQPFDPGPVSEPFATLARNYPGADTYDPNRFRVEWGPIFHRGRLDGSARILMLGQDPGQHESIAHRCLVGEAGQRVQGFLWKLGIERSYVMVNAFLYSVYGQPRRNDVEELLKRMARYRKRWLDALLDDTDVEAVVAFGAIAEQAFLRWQRTASGTRFEGPFEPLTHPTMPDATARPGTANYSAAMKRLLDEWNAGLARLDEALGPNRDRKRTLAPYGDELQPDDRKQIPEHDMPPGTPPWMRSLKQWATRKGTTADAKRATIEVRVPTGERPWQ